MKKDMIKTVITMILCAVGCLLIGFNAAHLSNGLNAALFVIGIVLISMSLTFEGLLRTVRKKKNKKTTTRGKKTQ